MAKNTHCPQVLRARHLLTSVLLAMAPKVWMHKPVIPGLLVFRIVEIHSLSGLLAVAHLAHPSGEHLLMLLDRMLTMLATSAVFLFDGGCAVAVLFILVCGVALLQSMLCSAGDLLAWSLESQFLSASVATMTATEHHLLCTPMLHL